MEYQIFELDLKNNDSINSKTFDTFEQYQQHCSQFTKIDSSIKIKSFVAKKDTPARENIEKKVDLAVYDKNYHMILRDLDGNRVTREIKEWIFDRKKIKDLYSFKMSLERLESSQYIHQLD